MTIESRNLRFAAAAVRRLAKSDEVPMPSEGRGAFAKTRGDGSVKASGATGE